MVRIGFYPGSFDPITFGHLDIIARAARLVDKLVIAVGAHDVKKALLTPQQRIDLVERCSLPISQHTGLKIEVVSFDGLTVDAARKAKAQIIVRGLRDASDFDYEVQKSQMNGALSPELETVFLAASPATRMIASSLVKQIAKMGGDISLFLPKESEVRLRQAIEI